jgi:nicotinamidase-related amidase
MNTALNLDPSKTALVLLHWQKEIASPEGRNSEGLLERLRVSGTIEHTQAVLKATREKGMLVVYVNGVHRPGYPELATRNIPLAKMMIENEFMLKGTTGVEIIDQLKPVESDIVMDNYSTSGFCYTELDLILRNKGITNIVLTGIATNMAVESTARDGFNRGYYVYTLEDCCKSVTDEMHDWTIKHILSFFGFVIDSQSYIAALNNYKNQ